MVTLLGRLRKGRPEEVGMVLFGSQSRGFSVGFRKRQETFTDHLNSGSARGTPLAEAFRGAATRGTAVPSDHRSHMDR